MASNQTGWGLAGGYLPGQGCDYEVVPQLFPELPPGDVDQDIYDLVFLSLFSDARMEEGDSHPDPRAPKTDRRGWWADSLSGIPGESFGSRLWLLSRAKATVENRALAVRYVQDALDWLVTDGLAESVEVAALESAQADVAIQVDITRGNGTVVTLTYPWVWDGIGGV